MKKLVKECVNRMYTFLLMNDDGKHDKSTDYWTAFIGAWDVDPTTDDFVAGVIEKTRLARPSVDAS